MRSIRSNKNRFQLIEALIKRQYSRIALQQVTAATTTILTRVKIIRRLKRRKRREFQA